MDRTLGCGHTFRGFGRVSSSLLPMSIYTAFKKTMQSRLSNQLCRHVVTSFPSSAVCRCRWTYSSSFEDKFVPQEDANRHWVRRRRWIRPFVVVSEDEFSPSKRLSLAELAERQKPLRCRHVIFVNPKSGGNLGSDLLKRFLNDQRAAGDIGIFSLIPNGPKEGLKRLTWTPESRILVCGGDGTVAWVLSEVDEYLEESKKGQLCCRFALPFSFVDAFLMARPSSLFLRCHHHLLLSLSFPLQIQMSMILRSRPRVGFFHSGQGMTSRESSVGAQGTKDRIPSRESWKSWNPPR